MNDFELYDLVHFDPDLVAEALKIAAAVARGEDTEYLLHRMPARDIEKLKTIRS